MYMYNKVNQLYVYIYPHIPSLSPSLSQTSLGVSCNVVYLLKFKIL